MSRGDTSGDSVDVTVAAGGGDEKELWSLRDSLAREPELRGRFRQLGGTPQRGTMGAVGEALVVAIEPGGAVAAFAAVAITWLRLRAGNVRLRVTQEDGSSVELLADRIRELDAQAIWRQVTDLTLGCQPPADTAEGGRASI